MPWNTDVAELEPGDVVIEAFGCRIPEPYVHAMASRARAPVWINLEYLSAETWIESCHGLPSPDPGSGLVKFFFFPGFAANTGGLIRESTYASVAQSLASAERRLSFLSSIGVSEVTNRDLPVSVFCYPGSPLDRLIALGERTWPLGRRPMWLLAESVATEYAALIRAPGSRVHVIPMLQQDDYDRLLLSCEINIVRGEDSFVRAQWTGKPFIWQAYRQDEAAHRAKVDAFLSRYLSTAPLPVADAVSAVYSAWNGFQALDDLAWSGYCRHLPAIIEHGRGWTAHLGTLGNLAERLVDFCESRL